MDHRHGSGISLVFSFFFAILRYFCTGIFTAKISEKVHFLLPKGIMASLSGWMWFSTSILHMNAFVLLFLVTSGPDTSLDEHSVVPRLWSHSWDGCHQSLGCFGEPFKMLTSTSSDNVVVKAARITYTRVHDQFRW